MWNNFRTIYFSISGSSLVKQPRPLPPLMPSLPLPNLISTNGTNNNNNRAVVVLSFVKGRRGECQGHRHLQELAAVVAAVAPPMLHRGRLLCSLESAQAAGMGGVWEWPVIFITVCHNNLNNCASNVSIASCLQSVNCTHVQCNLNIYKMYSYNHEKIRS